jgi:hypothetical protein
MANPKSGDLICGSGGIRKVRRAAHGKGKRGGLRVIYAMGDPEIERLLRPECVPTRARLKPVGYPATFSLRSVNPATPMLASI